MAFYFVVSAVERSLFEVNVPTSDSIRSALASIRFPNSRWVGPAPRITRDSSGLQFNTRVSWILEVDGPYTPEGALAQARHDAGYINGALSEVSSGWDPVSISPYNGTVNGDLSWWQSGEAAVTQTQNQPMGVLGEALRPLDNPYGPNNALSQPPSVSDLATDLISSPAKILNSTGFKVAAAAVGVGVLLYLTWPIISRSRNPSEPQGYHRKKTRKLR